MIIAIHQPNFLPNLSFFYKMARADRFVVATNMQFGRGDGWQRRQKIKTAQGDQWLTVPVYGSQYQRIRDVKINNAIDWRRKHTGTLARVYSRTREKDVLARLLALYYAQEWQRLVDLNLALITLLKEVLGITTPVILDEVSEGRKCELIRTICQLQGADTYLSGVGGTHYFTADQYALLSAHHIAYQAVDKDMASLYSYSAAHYILTRSRAAVHTLLS